MSKMTERQLAEQKEAKKVKIYTIAFVVVLVVLVAVAAFAGINQQISSRGIRERNTVAVTVGSHEFSNADLSYYFIDGINNFYSQNGAYAAMFGLDVTKALDKQTMSEDGTTWADYFMENAKETARSAQAICDRAAAEGFTLPADKQAQIDSVMENVKMYAALNGYPDAEAYLKAYYGNGSTVEGYKTYYSRNVMADAYQAHYLGSLNFTNDEIRAHESGKEIQYNAYTYNQYYLTTAKFLTGGTTDEDGTVTYTAEEKAAAAKAAEEAAKSVIGDDIKTVADMDKAINALSVNADSEVSSTAFTNTLYTALNSVISDWVSDPSRVEGDKVCLPSITNTTDEDGNEVENVNGYYVVFFHSASDNNTPVVNVRHILIGFEGGTEGDNGATVYSAEEKAAAKTTAESLLEQWKSGDATEDSFAALATANTTDTGSQSTGGLYENVYQGQMVKAFNDWCFDSARKPGDTGIVETEYGYHVMYFVGTGAHTYRDTMIIDELQDEAYEAWYEELINATPRTDGTTPYIRKDIVLNANGQ